MHLFSVTVFGDQLNAVNISGIIVIFMGVFLYKVTLHINHNQREALSTEKNSDPDLTLRFRIDLEDEEVRRDLTNNIALRGRSSPHSSNGNLEIDGGEEDDLVLV
jgi:hypothetical protein